MNILRFIQQLNFFQPSTDFTEAKESSIHSTEAKESSNDSTEFKHRNNDSTEAKEHVTAKQSILWIHQEG